MIHVGLRGRNTWNGKFLTTSYSVLYKTSFYAIVSSSIDVQELTSETKCYDNSLFVLRSFYKQTFADASVAY